MSVLRKIKAVEARPDYRIVVSWDRGQSTVDLSAMIKNGGVFAPLSDPDKFKMVRIGENNRIVEWPIPHDDLGYPIISIDADALFETARQQLIPAKLNLLGKIIRTVREDSKVPTSSRV